MFTRPADLPDSHVETALRSGWALAAEVAHAPLGFGSHHWYAAAGDTRFFVTVDDLTVVDPNGLGAALGTARDLRDAGLEFVVAPLPTTGGDLLEPIGTRYVATLYPMVEGDAPAWGPYATSDGRSAMLGLLARLHTSPRHAWNRAHTDDFAIPSREALDAPPGSPNGPFADRARRLLAEHRGTILERFARYDHMVGTVAPRRDRFVITHGEPHRANTISTDEGVVLVDWDTALVAPPERDLWWLAREDDSIAAGYESRTGVAVDPDAVDLYRARWDLTDLTLFAAGFLEPHEDDADTRTAWEAFVRILES